MLTILQRMRSPVLLTTPRRLVSYGLGPLETLPLSSRVPAVASVSIAAATRTTPASGPRRPPQPVPSRSSFPTHTYPSILPARITCPPRFLSTTATRPSGHSKWAKIKHDKAKKDAALSRQRTTMARDLVVAVRRAGADPTTNPRLAALLVEAKRQGFPKTSVERCVARGQGVSTSGAPLEAISLEFVFPPSVGGIVEAETDNRTRTTQELKALLRKHGAAASPSAFMFDRRGRLAWDAGATLTEDRVLEAAIDAGALDVESLAIDGEEDGSSGGGQIIVWTEPTEMARVADRLAQALGGVPPGSQELAWRPKEDARIDGFESEAFDAFMAKLDDMQEIQEVYLNIA